MAPSWRSRSAPAPGGTSAPDLSDGSACERPTERTRHVNHAGDAGKPAIAGASTKEIDDDFAYRNCSRHRFIRRRRCRPAPCGVRADGRRPGRAGCPPCRVGVGDFECSVVGLSERTSGTLSPTSMIICCETSGCRLSTPGARGPIRSGSRESRTRVGAFRQHSGTGQGRRSRGSNRNSEKTYNQLDSAKAVECAGDQFVAVAE